MIERPEWDGRTVVCIGSGPSLTVEDCELVRESGHPVVVANTTFQLCPWADALYAHDTKWWKFHHAEVDRIFSGKRFAASPVAQKFGANSTSGVPWFKQFSNSGACAASLAISGGARRVVMLGYDASLGLNGETHYHGDHPKGLSNAESINKWPAQFATLSKYANSKRVEIVNSSRMSSLTQFKRVTLGLAL